MASDLELYRQSIDTVTSLVTEENQHTTIPACPDWTLRDLLGHQAGVVEDCLNDNLADLGAPHWTAAQVDRHRHLDLAGIKTKWLEFLDSAGDAAPEIAGNLIPDFAIHEFDARGAVGNTDNRNGELVAAAFPMFAGFLDDKFKAMGLPANKVITDVGEAVIGDGDPQGELRLSGFDFLRMVTGRRSLNQIGQLDWSVDSQPWLEYITLMPPRDSDLVE